MTSPLLAPTSPVRPFSGLAVLALVALHAALGPQGAWALLSTGDVAAIAMGLGLLFGSHRVVGAAFLLLLMVGMPTLVLGMVTTHAWDASTIAVDVVPLVFGGRRVAVLGLPRRAWINAWTLQIVSMTIAAYVAPPALNLDFAAVVWKPLAATLSLRAFQTLLTVVVGALLGLGQLVVGWVSRGATSADAPVSS